MLLPSHYFRESLPKVKDNLYRDENNNKLSPPAFISIFIPFQRVKVISICFFFHFMERQKGEGEVADQVSEFSNVKIRERKKTER